MELRGTLSAKGKNHVEAISTDTVEAISTILFKMLQQHMLASSHASYQGFFAFCYFVNR